MLRPVVVWALLKGPVKYGMNPKTTRDVLVFHQGALGDFVVTFPGLMALRQRFQTVHGLCRSDHGRLAGHLGLIDQAYPLEAACFASLYGAVPDPAVRELIQRFECIVLFSTAEPLVTQLQAFRPGKVHVIAPRPPALQRELVSAFVLQQLTAQGLITTSAVSAGGTDTDPLWPGADANHETVFLHPGSGSLRKNWSRRGFLEVARRLYQNGLSPAFLLGPAEAIMMRHASPPPFDPFPVHCPTDACDLADRLLSGGAYIGNDSGVSHLAAFLGLPCVVLFGPSDPLRWYPVGRSVSVLRPDLDCQPCFETHADNCEQAACLADFKPAQVVDALHTVRTCCD